MTLIGVLTREETNEVTSLNEREAYTQSSAIETG